MRETGIRLVKLQGLRVFISTIDFQMLLSLLHAYLVLSTSIFIRSNEIIVNLFFRINTLTVMGVTGVTPAL